MVLLYGWLVETGKVLSSELIPCPSGLGGGFFR